MPDPKPARGEVLIAVKAAALRRLRELFANVNKGLCPDVSLPRRVDLIVPIQLLGKLRIFIQQHLQLGPQTQKFHDLLVHALRHRHARTVWATTTRNGTWSNLHAYHMLGGGTAMDAQNRMQPIFNALEGVIENMLGDDTLSTAHDYLNELKRAAVLWKDKFLADATASLRPHFFRRHPVE
jgi:hypothetical protein